MPECQICALELECAEHKKHWYLRNCPFCGSDKVAVDRDFTRADQMFVECKRCLARGPIATTNQNVGKFWNGDI